MRSLRLLAVVLLVAACIGGGLVVWRARQAAGLSGTRAARVARSWLQKSMGYHKVEVTAKEWFAQLGKYETSVWAVSANAAVLTEGDFSFQVCWGVIVDAQTGEVLGAVGGKVDWLKC